MNISASRKLVCEECELSKIKVKNIPREASTRSDQPIYRLHVDLSGRKLSTLDGKRYYLLMTDDYSRYRWVKLLSTKDEAIQTLKSFIDEVEREKAPCRVSVIRSDCGGEFFNKELNNHLSKLGIRRERSAPYSQHQNGVAERAIGVIDDAARTMMLYAGSPVYDWCHAINHSVHVRNRVPSKALGGRVPIEVYTGVRRKLRKNMPVFGCLGYAKVNVRGKHENKGRRVVFLCAGDETTGDLVRDITSFHSSLEEYESRNVTYDIRQYPYKSRLVPRPPPKPLDEEDIKEQLKLEKLQRERDASYDVKVHQAEVKDDGSEGWEVERVIDKRVSRFGPRNLSPEERGFDYRVVWKPEGLYPDSWEPEACLAGCEDAIAEYELKDSPVSEAVGGLDELEGGSADDAHVSVEPSVRRSRRIGSRSMQLGHDKDEKSIMSVYAADPASRAEAMASDQKEEWLAAELDELKSIEEHGVWKLVDRTPDMNVLGSKFVYKLKRHPDGTIDKFKVRLVAQGFKQKQGVDYQQIFATTAAMQAIRMALWVAVFYKFEIWKLDIKTFFLYGDLEERIFMRQPQGYEVGNKVCELSKALYGLKQSMRCALKCLTDQLALQGIYPLKTDQNIFFRKDDQGVVIMSAWVDDVLLFASSVSVGNKVVEGLRHKFELSVDENPSDYLQLQFSRDKENRQSKLYQTGYIERLAENYNIGKGDGLKIPFTTTNDLLPLKDMVLDQSVPFMELVGSLIWLLKTRPDVSIYISIIARYMSKYDRSVFAKAMRLLRYLYGTKDMGLVYDESGSIEHEYGKGVRIEFEVDSDFGGRLELGGKSTTGWICRANNSVVYSGCVIQKRVATSTTESESNGLEVVCKEGQWYRDFLNELEIDVKYAFPVAQDNKGALTLTEDPKNRPRTKYFRISQAYIRSQRVLGNLEFFKKDGKLLNCDMLNKLLYFPEFSRHRSGLLGNQNVLKKSDKGKEFSSDSEGDGPRVALVEESKVERERRMRRASQSNHRPPMIAYCMECSIYLEWSENRQDWMPCPCDNGPVFVSCIMCKESAWWNNQLCQWICLECVQNTEFSVPVPRQRRAPRRFEL